MACAFRDFITGNVRSEDLGSIVERGKTAPYVDDFVRGLDRCRMQCEYFSTCYGGQPGNKFFELGTLDGTETSFCRNSAKLLADAIVCELTSQKKEEVKYDVA